MKFKNNPYFVLESISSSQHNDNFVQYADLENFSCEKCNEKFFHEKNYDRHLSNIKNCIKLVELNSPQESKQLFIFLR